MWCFASSRNHRDIRSRLCGGIVTSVWRRCCCLRDPLQSILNNSFRLHFSLKLQFCVSLFVSSPKEEPEKDEKRIKGRLFLSSLTQIKAEILAMSQNQIRAWISHSSWKDVFAQINCIAVAIKYLYCLQLVAKQRKQAVIKETATCQYPMCVKNALLFNKWWNKTRQSSTLVSSCQKLDRDKCWHLHKPETNFWLFLIFQHFQNGWLYSIGQAKTM